MKNFIRIFIILSLIFSTLYAIDKSKLPTDLQEWQEWVLYGEDERECPLDFQKNRHICSWPSQMDIELNKNQLDFNITWNLFKDNTKIILAGDENHWVYDVKVDEKEAIVLDNNKRATLILNKGLHNIQGSINWNNKAKYLQLPPNIALVNLYKNGKKIENINIDKRDRLWFEKVVENSIKKGTLNITINRKISDQHPMKVLTQLHLRISGKSRTLLIEDILLDDFIPLSIKGNLQATITENRKLQIDAKAGEWDIYIDSYNPKPILELKKAKNSTIETWVFESNPKYRRVKIEGVQQIDPSQTNLPNDWKHLPSYLIDNNSQMKITQLYKSEQIKPNNNFIMQRECWLDFDGNGYTIVDNISATLDKITRLEMSKIIDLGSVMLNNKPQLITTLKDSDLKGVELREANPSIKTVSRYTQEIDQLPANGWNKKFNSINLTLNLPPSWQLLASFGSDSKGNSWIERWNLMDIFLVMLIVIAIYKLFGWQWAISSSIILILLWQNQNAPTLVWLTLLSLVALIRLLNKSSIKTALQIAFIATISLAIWQVLVFSTYEIRTALYPQLEKHNHIQTYPYDVPMSAPIVEESISKDSYIKTKSISRRELNYQKKDSYNTDKTLIENRFDPDAIVQTGPGIPNWKWNTHQFYWQSGIGSDDRLELWLLSPTATKIIKILRVLGMLFLLYMFLKEYSQPIIKKIKTDLASKQTIKTILLISILTQLPLTLKADIPDEAMLKELKTRLTKTPPCFPNCTQIESTFIQIEDNQLQVKLKMLVATNSAIQLLGNRTNWLPQNVTVDDNQSANIRIDKESNLWINLTKGKHTVYLNANIKNRDKIQLTSALRLHNISFKSDESHSIQTNNKNYIEIISKDKDDIKKRKKFQNTIEPLVQIERTFHFGHRWYIDTDVTVLNSIDRAYTIEYTLLPNESVLDKNIQINDKKVQLHLSKRIQSYHWRSSIPIENLLELKASKDNHIVEIWKMDVASLWHMSSEGISPLEQIRSNNLLMPLYKPWQNEVLKITLEYAKAIKGDSITIKSSNLTIKQSQRYADITLNLNLLSSQAQDYQLKIENLKELKSVMIDGQNHFIKANNTTITIPIQPKEQNIIINYIDESRTKTVYNFPKIDLLKQSVNSKTTLQLPQDRWVLWTFGPLLGPAVLFWGVIVALLLFTSILAKVQKTPLQTMDWFLLGVGVSTTSITIIIPIIIWIFVLRYRELHTQSLKGRKKNAFQILLVILTIISLITIFSAVSVGLLGSPDMMVTGNNSSEYYLNWYSDRIENILPQPTVISISLWYYRALMLLWAIWISFSLIKWLKYAWEVFSNNGIWEKSIPKIKEKKS